MIDLRYPSDLAEISGGHIIVFTILKDNPINFSSTAKFLGSMFEGEPQTNSVTGNTSNSSINSAKNIFYNVAEEANAFVSGSAAFKKSLQLNPSTSSPEGSISLYMPDTINLNQSNHWDDLSLTEAFGLFGFSAQTSKSVIDQFKNSDSPIGAVKNLLSSNETAASAIEGMGLLTNKSAISNYALSLGGIAVNPQLELLYKGLGFRTFQYEFNFSPKSQSESETVEKIIRTFRKYSSPTLNSGGAVRYFNVPNKFDIEYYFKGARNKYLHKIAQCVLETVQVDYASRGWTTFKDGAPVDIRLILQFKEVVIIDKHKIDEGY